LLDTQLIDTPPLSCNPWSRYGVLVPDAGVALRGLFIINPEVWHMHQGYMNHVRVAP